MTSTVLQDHPRPLLHLLCQSQARLLLCPALHLRTHHPQHPHHLHINFQGKFADAHLPAKQGCTKIPQSYLCTLIICSLRARFDGWPVCKFIRLRCTFMSAWCWTCCTISSTCTSLSTARHATWNSRYMHMYTSKYIDIHIWVLFTQL